jgi:hypothetical protein
MLSFLRFVECSREPSPYSSLFMAYTCAKPPSPNNSVPVCSCCRRMRKTLRPRYRIFSIGFHCSEFSLLRDPASIYNQGRPGREFCVIGAEIETRCGNLLGHAEWFHSFLSYRPSSHFSYGVVSSFSSVSTTNTASSLAGLVLLAFSLTLCRSPGISEKLSPVR